MVIEGTFISINKKAGKEPNGIFTILCGGQYIKCKGSTPSLRNGYPLSLTGEYENSFFVVKDMNIGLANETDFVNYFSSPVFKGMGKVQASSLYNSIKELVLSECIENDVLNILKKYKKISEAVNELIVENVLCLYTRKKIEEELKSYNAKSSDIEQLYQKYRGKAVTTIKENPYEMVKFSISFLLCDNIAFEKQYMTDDERRIDAILYELSKKIYTTGSSCMKLEDVITELNRIQKKSRFKKLSEFYLMSEVMSSGRFVIKCHGDDIRVYTKHSMYIEDHIASELYRLTSSVIYTGFKGANDYPDLDEDQTEALKHLRTSGVKVITGGPGAGKTTLIKKYIEEYKKLNPENQFYLCAPTGRAAVRIQESSGYPAKTIHKLLGYQPYSKDQSDMATTYNKSNQFPVALFIVDEMSMVGEELFLKFLEAVPNGSTVILSGDPAQLKSVDPGNVLTDLIESGTIPVCKLTHIHRQGSGSSIVRNYYRIKNKEKELEYDDSFQAARLQNKAEIKMWVQKIKETYEDINNPYSFQIITFIKSGDFGKDTLNTEFAQNNLNGMDITERSEKVYKNSNFAVGDKIMMTANNYSKGYWNGDIGVIRSVSDENILAEFYDGYRTIDKDSMQDMDHAWAATTHKSQGSEYDTVLVIVDDQCPTMLYNSLILTAVTRAKDRVFVISVNDALERAIVQDEPSIRTTWLDILLQEKMGNETDLPLPDAA